MRATLFASLLLLAACSSRAPEAGRWTGTLAPTTPGPACEPARATLDFHSDRSFLFAPTDGTLIIPGTATSDGKATAAMSRTGADKRPYVTRLDATVTTGRIQGTYRTPRCVFDVSLTPTSQP